MASRLATGKLCRELDPNHTWEGAFADSPLSKTLQVFNAAVSDADRLDLASEPDGPTRQQTLSQALDRRAHDEFLASLNTSDKRALMSELLPGASAFLEAIPSKEHNLAWEPTEFATEVRSRLLANVFPEESWCPASTRCSIAKAQRRISHEASSVYRLAVGPSDGIDAPPRVGLGEDASPQDHNYHHKYRYNYS